ncbi:MAG: AAA family ATPase, partial [Chloroflexota bacterium]|nr:AAA family ATPase [Chloroflexota bacterium]
MRIERIEIDGFGRFHDAHWSLNEGLTVLVGANEAGKTTLLNALRALLFGFDATRDGRTWYPALAGGRRGGRLVLRTAGDERWTVERHGDRGGGGALAVRAPNGNQGGQETLDRLLHGADRGLFNNIFAFGLTELQTFDTLSADGVRGRIYGAGAGLGRTSAVEVERRLRQAQEGVFLPRGQRPLNLLLARIESLRREIADLARQPEEYIAAHRERSELGERTSTLRAELRSWRERAIRLANLRSAGPLAAELTTIEADLAAGDATLDALPLDAMAVLDRRLADLAETRAALTTIDEQVDAARVALAGLQLDERLLAAGDEIVALRDERAARSAAEARRRELE